jgi:hypothetical protein
VRVSPYHALARSWALPPVGNYTLPRRLNIQLRGLYCKIHRYLDGLWIFL